MKTVSFIKAHPTCTIPLYLPNPLTFSSTIYIHLLVYLVPPLLIAQEGNSVCSLQFPSSSLELVTWRPTMKTCWLKKTRLRLSPGSNINETLKKPSVSHGNKVQTLHYPFQLIRGLDKWGGDPAVIFPSSWLGSSGGGYRKNCPRSGVLRVQLPHLPPV